MPKTATPTPSNPTVEISTSAGARALSADHSSLLRAFDIHSRTTVYLIQDLSAEAWRAAPPGGKGRDIAAIVAHIHGVHNMWLKAAGSDHLPLPLNKATVTPAEAIAGLTETAAALHALIAKSLQNGVRVKNFKPDTAAFVGYMIAHDAHHRGQIAMLARQAGFPLSKKAGFGLWEWGVR